MVGAYRRDTPFSRRSRPSFLPETAMRVDSLLRCAPVASFAPTHVALRAAFGRLPSQRPLACVRSRSASRPYPWQTPCKPPLSTSAPPRVDSFAPALLALSGSLRESPERLPKPPGSRETIWFGFISPQISQLELGDGVAEECWMT